MRAVVCPRASIPPSGLVYTTTHPKPLPKPGHVLIRVKAFGLNRSELFTRQGHSPGIQFPRVLGIECVGTVQDAGGGSWKEGDVVAAVMGGMGRQFDGGYAEYALIPAKQVSQPVKLPEGMGWAEFGAIPETFFTAWAALSESLKLTSKDTLLIRGGTSSVGVAAATLAKSSLFSCPKVISTTRSPGKVDKLRTYGADRVIIEDESASVAEKVKELTGGKGADKCIELVGPPTLDDSCNALADNGVVSVVGVLGGVWTCKEFDPMGTLAPRKHLTMYSSHYLDVSKAPLQWIMDAVARGEVHLGLDKVFKIEEAGAAHEYMEANKASGKVVCLVD
ncbi:Zn-dependent oxidoreductase [Gloeophyllum trabeum ATCC 11539]|uniref:Zn-dependent oxidoreductase n=1 Tax=Gloeophyllum trabeum (strain ATCC 11539 / FP-39264 / Madison 617) TaxID=670483 RepID=S7REL8_GLOTA|nr:Zn-dependent oxidoreductase [Gloeophyllum trabeum ATCC 11539]EPQ52690.1 Zn-dependent oxidoreductase [Gloeophyllum trabeum ATCC 11539]